MDPVTPLLVCGFHRSGTTLVATAATAATGGATLTVGHLAGRIPSLALFLRTPRDTPADRGVDRLEVTESTPEEYGWLLRHATGAQSVGADPAAGALLRELVDQLAGESNGSYVVLKNPWDTGHEKLLLRHLPDARILLVRRGLAAIEESSERALLRFLRSDGYLRALMADSAAVDGLLAALADPVRRRVLLFLSRWRVRVKAILLARSALRLPRHRVGFLCYDELRTDPVAGAAWAAHLIDPVAFADAFTAAAFPDGGGGGRRGWVIRRIDAYWARSWRRARTAQLRDGVLPAGPVPVAGPDPSGAAGPG
jgi:hypothetical protein